MQKLNVYRIGDLDGRHEAAVAAPTKAAAADMMGVRVGARAEICRCDDDPRFPAVSAIYRLAMATPWIVWLRPIVSVDGERPWTCRDERAGAGAVVRLRFPHAVSLPAEDGEGHGIWVGDFGRPIGSGDTEDAAWLDAARRISVEPPDGLPPGAVVFWRHEDAPPAFRELDAGGGDRDWIAWVPEPLCDRRVGWLDRDETLGRFGVARYPIRGGEVRIGTHGPLGLYE